MYPNVIRPVRDLCYIACLLAAVLVSGCGDGETSPSLLPGAPFSQSDLRVGTGADAAVGRRLTVTYTGWLYDHAQPENKGRQFDTNVNGTPFQFVLGAGQVIRGWDQGFVGMKVGGLRRLVIPPDLAYGSTGAGGGLIPPGATLVFDVELVGVQ